MGTTVAPSIRVVAVVVAYNRAGLVRECLDAVLRQSRPVAAIVVVDNASTDATPTVLDEFGSAIDLITLPRNTGGAGGFAVGIARAMVAHGADLVWIMDDDTIPATDAAEQALTVRSAASELDVIASTAVWTDGRPHPMNTPRAHGWATSAWKGRARALGGTPIRSASFVSIFVNGSAVLRCGLPVADYFLWNDDFEYSTRLLRGGRGMLLPGSRVVHKTAAFASTDVDPGPRFYYEVRNKLWLFSRSASLSPVEKLIYGGSTVLRWLKTYRHSTDRALLAQGLRRGLRDGIRRPRSNAQVFDDLPEVLDILATFETQRRHCSAVQA